MTPRPLIHIGMPKCASTWLQRQFFRPRFGYAPAISNEATSYMFVQLPAFQFDDWREARRELKLEHGDKVPVVSAEVLVGNPLTGGHNAETNLQRLQRAVPEARILLIIREQRAMLRSLYKTLVNFGSPLSLQMHLSNNLPGNVPAFDPTYLNYDRPIRAYQQVFGRESVQVLPMEQFQSEPEVFLRAISEFNEVDLSRYPALANTQIVANPNRNLVSLELKRLFNRFVARTRMSPSGLYTPPQIGTRGNIDPPAPAFLEHWLERRFTQRVARMTAGRFAASNDATQSLTQLDLGAYGYELPGEPEPR